MGKKLKFYDVELGYIKYLKRFEDRISDVSSENFKNRRKFIGILIEIENVNYVAPLTSPKEKHTKLKDTLDFLKIKEGEYGAINFNNMFPVPNELIKEFKVQDEQDMKYKSLLEKQLSWCNEEVNKNKILKVSKKLYKLYIGEKLPEHVKNRCCDFKMMEEKVLNYLEIQKLEKKFETNKKNYEFIINNLKEISESIKDKNYNCLTGNQILVKSHFTEDRKWIPASLVKEENISIKENEIPIKGILTNIEEGKLYIKPIEYYNVSQLNITKEIEQKFVPMKEKEKTVEKAKDKEIER